MVVTECLHRHLVFQSTGQILKLYESRAGDKIYITWTPLQMQDI